jgi:hypothetical protein
MQKSYAAVQPHPVYSPASGRMRLGSAHGVASDRMPPVIVPGLMHHGAGIWRNMMIHLRFAVLLGVVIAGCAAYWQAHTEGTSGPIAWYIADARSAADPVGERYAYAFVLVLQETQGTALTFTTMTYTVYSGTATHSGSDERTIQGPWKLRAHGTFRFPFTFTVTCPEGSGCIKLEPLAPTYHVVLSGTDSQAKPVRVIIDTKLPPDPSVIPKH